MAKSPEVNLTEAQNELYEWIKNYIKDFQHSPSIRQMMSGLGLKSPTPIQSRLNICKKKDISLARRKSSYSSSCR